MRLFSAKACRWLLHKHVIRHFTCFKFCTCACKNQSYKIIWCNILHVCDADLSMEGEGDTEICMRFSEVMRSCRVLLISRSWATVQLFSTEPSSSSASTCCSSCWICCSRHRLRSFSSVSLCCSSAISSCTGL